MFLNKMEKTWRVVIQMCVHVYFFYETADIFRIMCFLVLDFK